MRLLRYSIVRFALAVNTFLLELTHMRGRYLIILLIVTVAVFAAVVGRAHAQSPPTIAVLLIPGTSQFLVGQVIPFTLQVEHPSGYQVIIPRLSQKWGDLEVRSQSSNSVVDHGDGTETTSQTIEAAIFAPGDFETPELTITIRTPEGEIIRGESPAVALSVIPTIFESDLQLRGIRPQANLPRQPIWPLILAGSIGGVLLLGLLGWGVYFFLKRMGWLPGMTRAVVDTRSPYEVALDDLTKIETLDLPAQGRLKEHYALVSNSIRRYLQNSYDVPVFGMTTDELNSALADSALRTDDTREVVGFLRECDRVKYASVELPVESARQSTSRARDLIELVTPVTAWTGRDA